MVIRTEGVKDQAQIDAVVVKASTLSVGQNDRDAFASILARSVDNQTVSRSSELGMEAPSANADRDTQLRWAAQQLEAFYLQELFAAMRKTVPEGGFFKKSFTTRTYEEMLDTEQAKGLAAAGGVGLAEVLLRQMRGEE